MIRNGRVMALAHRVAWVMQNGQIPQGKHILHSCDQPLCVNWRHLRPGTNQDNIDDKVRRGRCPSEQPRKQGERHHSAKLTVEAVQEIRRSNSSGRDLAKRFGVSPATVTNVRKRNVWKSV